MVRKLHVTLTLAVYLNTDYNKTEKTEEEGLYSIGKSSTLSSDLQESGVYPMGALMNHSCQANVNMMPSDEITFWYAMRDIEEVH